MSNELKHENGDVYPNHFANNDVLTADIMRHLCPYVFKKDQVGRRNFLLETLIAYHTGLTKRDLRQTVEEVGKRAKKSIFRKESTFFVSIEGFGNYRYIGDSVGDGFKKPEVVLEPDQIKNDIIPEQELKAREAGKQSLYVWWHRDSEELATLKNDTSWAMKIGKHNSPYVSSRFDSYKVAIPHKIRLGLIVSCKNSSRLEKAVHGVLENKGKKIGEEGSEWFNTNVSEVIEILRFQELIE